MNRFTPSHDNLRIAIDDSAVEPYVLAAATALRKAGARKVYFVGLTERSYPLLNVREDAQFTVLEPVVEPSNLLESSRILHRVGQLVIVHSRRLRKDDWRQIAAEIEADVPGGENAD